MRPSASNSIDSENQASVSYPGDSDLLGRLVRLAARRAEIVKRDASQILASARKDRNSDQHLGSEGFLQSAYMLGYLYGFEHPDNPLYRQGWCAELAIDFTDFLPQYLREGKARGEEAVTAEWSPLGTVELLDILKPDGRRKADWLEFIEGYVDFARRRPFGFTSPNHEAWRELFLYRAGQILDRPKLCDLGLFFTRQQMTYQTPEGFWEEGRHHGPSMVYNTLMLEPLAWLYRLSGAEDIGAAARRLVDFMAGWCFPDGCTVGAFDGRQTTAFGFGVPVCPGLELTPAGRTLNARGLQLYAEGDYADSGVRGSVWYDHFALFFWGTAVRYFAELVPAAEHAQAATSAQPLPAEVQGVRERHTPTFSGLLARQGKWCIGLSSQFSDAPRSIFRLERCSRIEIWHADARLTLGGGHNRKDWAVPYANAILDTGFAGETRFGRMDQEKHPRRRSYYLPHAIESGCSEGRPELHLHFAHGRVTFRFLVENDQRLGIHATWQLREVKRLCLQLPLVVWRGATVKSDGSVLLAQAPEPAVAVSEVTVEGGEFGRRVGLQLPEAVPARVHLGLTPLRSYGDPVEPQPEALFTMALVSSQWDEPPREGRARWVLTVSVEPCCRA